MTKPDEQKDLDAVSAILAELRADTKPLALDLVKGINAYALLAVISALMGGFTFILALILLIPGYFRFYSGVPYFGIVLLTYPIVGFWVTYKSLRRHNSLNRKYSRLIEEAKKLGD